MAITKDNTIRAYDGYYAKAQAITTSQVDGNSTVAQLGNLAGAIVVRIYAATEVTVIDTKVLTINLLDSADNSSFAQKQVLAAITGTTGNTVFAIGDQIGEDYILPNDCDEYTKITLGANFATAGTIDVAREYLAR